MKKLISATLAATLALSLAACGSSASTSEAAPAESTASSAAESAAESTAETSELAGTTLKVAASPTPHAEILNVAKEILAEQGIDLQVVEFSDYVQPNLVTESALLFRCQFPVCTSLSPSLAILSALISIQRSAFLIPNF